MSTPAIRLAQPEDHPALAALMVEMQGHYEVPCPPRDEILAGLAALPEGVDILVAAREGAILGFASACNLYPGPGLKSGFFLKELYVAGAASRAVQWVVVAAAEGAEAAFAIYTDLVKEDLR